MPDILKIIKSRKTTYEFSDKPVKKSEINKILEAARWAPSSHNDQNWSFIVVESQEEIRQLLMTSYYGEFHTNPRAIIAVVMEPLYSKHPGLLQNGIADFIESHKYMNIALPVMIMLLEAESLGIKTCILSPKVDDANKLLGVPEGRKTLLLVGLGHEKKGAFQKKRERKGNREIIFNGRYGKPRN